MSKQCIVQGVITKVQSICTESHRSKQGPWMIFRFTIEWWEGGQVYGSVDLYCDKPCEYLGQRVSVWYNEFHKRVTKIEALDD